MKMYKKIMDGVAVVEKAILVSSTLLILVLTVGNVFSRKVIHRSWSFTEELVVAVFVLITLLAAALASREGELVSLSLFTDRLPEKIKKPSMILITVLSVIFTAVLFKYGFDKVLIQLANGKRTFVLNWPEWIFWSFIPIGAGCMILHLIEYCIDFCRKDREITSKEKEDK
ncbi:TRAP transporter small permease [Hespellia stercorisuis]|uniref:TRAP-type C4-dicarboxylate transport system, small permease component n=1 Tax=Hespellia stercorisuis DSM 15480 TaxID=1121950 RepID=A0A1M6I1F2_9FIRM|nr:TRAP transporter small permease [Hespellia stercorisuis]SHJ28312.1 TRAP-type C4-dicarboxylate transport system, small permease component [Hespellia stercorisuis DSM 15480]